MSGTVKLHDYWRSSSAWRVRIALNLKGIAYERVPHNLLKGEQRADAYVGLAPQGLVPALEIDGIVLTQSVATIEWLNERFPEPPLLPPDREGRATVRAMAAVIASDIQPLQNLRVLRALKARFEADQAAIDDWARHWIVEGLAALEVMVGRHGKGFCHGDAPGLADCLLIPQLYNAARFRTDMTRFPLLRAVQARCEGLPAFAAAHPDRQEEATPPP